MSARSDLFDGEDPIAIVRRWQEEAWVSEPNDADAMALATVDATGLPNVRMVLLKEIEDDGFVFYTNYESAKGNELATNENAAFVIHWKSLRRQVRVRGSVVREEGLQADTYYESRPLQSRIGAWASAQSRPLESRAVLV
ncbi:MAG: pyridoxal 5'-phosphate synthase, partial [Boseongicola sp.]